MYLKTIFCFKELLIKQNVSPLGTHEEINVIYSASLCKSLWEVKIDSLQWWLCPEISLKSRVVPNFAVHIHHSKRL